MHYKKLLKAHELFYSGEYRAEEYDKYVTQKDWQTWKGPILSDNEITKLWDFILKWDFHFKGDEGKFKQIYQEIYPVIQALEGKRIEDANFDDEKLKEAICEVFDKVVRCPREHRHEYTDASKILHTILPNLFVMWDENIRYAILGKVIVDGEDYAYHFLPLMQKELKEAINTYMEENNSNSEEAIKKISEQCDGKTLAKLIDEFNYTQYTLRKEV